MEFFIFGSALSSSHHQGHVAETSVYVRAQQAEIDALEKMVDTQRHGNSARPSSTPVALQMRREKMQAAEVTSSGEIVNDESAESLLQRELEENVTSSTPKPAAAAVTVKAVTTAAPTAVAAAAAKSMTTTGATAANTTGTSNVTGAETTNPAATAGAFTYVIFALLATLGAAMLVMWIIWTCYKPSQSSEDPSGVEQFGSVPSVSSSGNPRQRPTPSGSSLGEDDGKQTPSRHKSYRDRRAENSREAGARIDDDPDKRSNTRSPSTRGTRTRKPEGDGEASF